MSMNKRFIIALVASVAFHLLIIFLVRPPVADQSKTEPVYVDIVKKKPDASPRPNPESAASANEDMNRQAGDERRDGRVAQVDPTVRPPMEPVEPSNPAPQPKEPTEPSPTPPKEPNPNEPQPVEPTVPLPKTPEPAVPETPRPNTPVPPVPPTPDTPREPAPDTPPTPTVPDDDRVARILDPSNVIRKELERQDQEQASGEGEDTVTIEAMKFRYSSYFHKFSRRLYQVWRYPSAAGMRGESGVARIGFSVLADGRVTNVRVINSSGYPDLDRAAVQALKDMAGVPLPESYDLKILNITGQFVYLNAANGPYVN